MSKSVCAATAAHRLWPGEEAVGTSVILGWMNPAPHEVVGVVGDLRTVSPDDDGALASAIRHAGEATA